MRAVWVGGPHDGDHIDIEDGLTEVQLALPPTPRVVDSPLESPLDVRYRVVPVRKFRTARGVLVTGLDYYDIGGRFYE